MFNETAPRNRLQNVCSASSGSRKESITEKSVFSTESMNSSLLRTEVKKEGTEFCALVGNVRNIG